MTRRAFPCRRAGYTLLEVLIATTIVVLISTAVFTGLAQYALLSSQEEVHLRLRQDLILSMDQVKRDIQAATNVVPRAGSRVTNNTTLVLRRPVLDAAGNVVVGAFEFITFAAAHLGDGLVREVWATETAQQPADQRVLNESIIAVGFLYGGRSIQDVTNLTLVRDVEVLLVSSRETGLRRKGDGRAQVNEYFDLAWINTLLQFGEPFRALRAHMDRISQYRMDVMLAASTGAASMRNRRGLGLVESAPPVAQ